MTDHHDTPGLFPDAIGDATAPAAEVPTAAAPVVETPRPTTHPCVSCDRFVYPEPGTQCYWCKRNEIDPTHPHRAGRR